MRTATVAALTMALVIGVASASQAALQDWTFEGNVSNLQGSGEFSYRFSNLVSGAGISTWVSASVKAHGSASGETGADINTIVGQMYAGTNVLGIGYPPWSWLAFIKASWAGTPTTGIFDGSMSALVMAYLSISEVKPNGDLVAEYDLKKQFSYSGAVAWGSDITTVNQSATINGAEVVFTYVVSNILGKLKFAQAIVSPKSLECIIEINNWPYVDPLNHLELKIGVATVDTKVSGNAIITRKDGESDDQVYFTLSDTSIVNGTIHDAEITGYVKGELNVGTTFDLWVNALLGGDYKAYTTKIKFAAGGKTIVYDPALAQGKQIVYGAASSMVPFSALLLFALALLLLL